MNEADIIDQVEFKKDLEPQDMLRVIFDYAAKIANERKLDQLLMLMADMGREMVVSDRCTVWLLDRHKKELYSTVAHGVPPLRMPMDAGLVGHAVSSGKPIYIDDAYTNEEFKEVLQSGAIAMDKQTGYRTKTLMVIPFRNNEGEIMGAYQAVNKLTENERFSQKDLDYLTLAASYAGKSIEAALLTIEIEETQKEIIFTMGEIGESRSKETGNHVKRVAEYSYILARSLGMSEKEAELLKIASPMHDIGKVAIPDAVLKKPGKLTNEEFDRMKTHTTIGYHLLKNSKRQILKTAAIVAYQHHEKWNGSGYPCGLRGEEIHIYGRITAIADVFDALGSDRVYKKAWELDRILNLFQEERGEHFDPKVVDVFIVQLPSILKAREVYSDLALEGVAEGYR
ncbi:MULTISPECIES: HD domain-containing phosphohydrolase [unclassified Paenibacillus]|uniref:HD domain-containing phosphohydrolase n=1 Tax=unclassified Paenibacillus TaxID=185978 RepID=UPI001B446471|nr:MULTISPECIES: HD domain-containing phosphohydrolase [unclassified Paenibacillus]MBP1154733.1 HD-GYP domain-containing protein (c-di-GMP phosphodiesterase class II) [Paenibacillus sp. PvP091]MBP1169883.1 HD-GYP domain-containing protein (c-di-GMP phosphodiesterase class II) [Paenibacillus sp. PvR098]MBP2440911.1 HD-GYP domain-containing protein (c-di-GMP phosphodiesterase class II) [Paenibacillus sp. PvP052]